MKQPDSMFIQKNASGDIYHLCYTDNTRETISRARFAELSRLATYEPEDGVYWFYSNKSGLAVPPDNAPKTHGSKKVVPVHHIDGKTETDADWQAWLCRRDELEDYAATVDAASYRQGV